MNKAKAKLQADWKKLLSTNDDQVLDEIWDDLDRDGYVDEALRMGDVGLKDLVDYAELPIKYWRLGQGRTKSVGRGEKSDPMPPHLSSREIERSAAFEEYVATIAATDPGVYRFRERVLDGQLLKKEQAQAFVASPATRFLSLGRFRALGIPLVGHDAELRDYKRERKSGRVRYSGVISFNTLGLEVPVHPRPNEKGHLPKLYFIDEHGYLTEAKTSLGSVLDELRELSDKLAERYSWQKAQATWFVLTGTIPAVPPVKVGYRHKRGRYFTRGEITLSVAPWVPAQVVYDAYRDRQRRVLGGANQPLREKNLRLLRFVLERIDPLGLLKEKRALDPEWDWRDAEEQVAYLEYMKIPEGHDLVAEWDKQEWVQQNPEDRAYRNNTRRFWRDYHRARRAVAFQRSKQPYQL